MFRSQLSMGLFSSTHYNSTHPITAQHTAKWTYGHMIQPKPYPTEPTYIKKNNWPALKTIQDFSKTNLTAATSYKVAYTHRLHFPKFCNLRPTTQPTECKHFEPISDPNQSNPRVNPKPRKTLAAQKHWHILQILLLRVLYNARQAATTDVVKSRHYDNGWGRMKNEQKNYSPLILVLQCVVCRSV